MEQAQPFSAPAIGAETKDSKENNNIIKIIVGTASAVAAIGIVFGIYGMVQSQFKDQQISDLKAQIEKESDVASDDGDVVSGIGFKEVHTLLRNYVSFDYELDDVYISLFENGLTEQYKYYLALKKLDYQSRTDADQDHYSVTTSYNLTYDEINDAYHDLFGVSSDVENQTFFQCHIPYFSESDNEYISIGGCGNSRPPTRAYEILDYAIEEEKLVVDIAYLYVFYRYISGDLIAYVALDGTDKEVGVEQANMLQKYLDDLPRYRLLFIKEDGKYILNAIEESHL